MIPVRVVNSSPLIVFHRLDQLQLLNSILEHAYMPPAVRREVFGSEPLPEWVDERSIVQPVAPMIAAARLGHGESEAIALALEMSAVDLVLDDMAARRLAQSLHLPVIGSVGLLLRAKNKGYITDVRPHLESMQRVGFHISARL